MEIEVLLDVEATIGESPTWEPDENALYWIDVKKPALYRYDPATGGQRAWPLPCDIGAFALVPDPPARSLRSGKGSFGSNLHRGR